MYTERRRRKSLIKKYYGGSRRATGEPMATASASQLPIHFCRFRSPPPPAAAMPFAASSPPSGGGRGVRIARSCAGRRLFGGSRELQEELTEEDECCAGFVRAVELFNGGDYHRCHDVLEELWYGAEEPARTLLHGVLQCAVGFHHLFNQNHRGAMMELGEGLCKLRKIDFREGPFLEFEKEVAAALEFLYQTQKELAACNEEFCLPMDGSDMSYQLLGSFAAGQHLYSLDTAQDGVTFIVFSNGHNYKSNRPKIKVPTLAATEEDIEAFH